MSSVAFHSYKGGTGKTTLAANYAAYLAKMGYRVCLLDLDVYAPSLHSYFDKEPQVWLNDYFFSELEAKDVVVDLTDMTNSLTSSDLSQRIDGKLWVGFCNPKREEVNKMDAVDNKLRKQLFKKLVFLREKLISNLGIDYLVMDTSPGIRYWSINALAIADIFLLTLKMGDIDIDGTKRMADEIYGSFIKHGSKSFLIWNRVSGYCIPSLSSTEKLLADKSSAEIAFEHGINMNTDVPETVAGDINMKYICAIPCYCDIQFKKKEFLTVLMFPTHPFSKQIHELVEAVAAQQ